MNNFFSKAFLIFIIFSQIACFAQSNDPTYDSLRAECLKNSAYEWSLELKRCVGKQEARKDRHESIDCNNIEDIEQRKNCHLQLASKKSGVTSDVESATSKMSDLQSRSALINGANTVVSIINLLAKDKAKNSCMSKNIMGITGLAGFVSDIYLKIQTKNKIADFKKKYQIDQKDTPYQGQVKALNYLREEQELVKSIAATEKKRQMLLMIGYGAAGAVAAYESVGNTSCWKKDEPKKEPEKKTEELKPTEEAKQAEDNQPIEESDQGAKPDEAQLAESNTAAAEPLSTEAKKPAQTLNNVQKGNFQYNYISEGDPPTPIAVVHDGKTYDKFSFTKDGRPIVSAGAKPTGIFDYNTGSWSGGQTSSVGITRGGTTSISNLSYGTSKGSFKPSGP